MIDTPKRRKCSKFKMTLRSEAPSVRKAGQANEIRLLI